MKLEILAAAQATIVAWGGWMFKRQIARIDELEKQVMNEQEIRQLINDKLDPMRVDMKNIKEDIGEMKGDIKTLVNRDNR